MRIAHYISIKLTTLVRNRISKIKRYLFFVKYKIRLPNQYKLGRSFTMYTDGDSKLLLKDKFFPGDYSTITIKGGHVVLGSDFNTRSFFNIYINGGYLEIGNDVFFNNNCSISCLNKISIGNRVMFGEGVKIYDHNHKYQYIENQLIVSSNDYSMGEINIGDNCWIGSNVTILKGVVIGNNSIIGAGCTIYKSIEANSIVINKQVLDIKHIHKDI